MSRLHIKLFGVCTNFRWIWKYQGTAPTHRQEMKLTWVHRSHLTAA